MADFTLGTKKGWRFPSNNDGVVDGIADAGIETFKGTPIKSLAREICQNSGDAALQKGQTVRLEFKEFKIPTDRIPGRDDLLDDLKKSAVYWMKNKKTFKFLSNAIKSLEQEYTTCLRISDFNTTGLIGSSEEPGTPWFNLTKGSGSSDKGGSNGGSFGIGKSAPFAVSDLRVVFYSTLDKKFEEKSQGVARLVTFKNDKGETTQGTGFFGLDKNFPVKEQLQIDPTFKREEGQTGTDIYVIGFNGGPNWQNNIIGAILDGFLCAIYFRKLSVIVQGIELNKECLPRLISEYIDNIEEHAEEYYKILNSSNDTVKVKELKCKDLGTAKLRLSIDPEFKCRTVAFVRETGMKIFDRPSKKGINLAGVLYIEGEQLNGLLVQLENVQHNKWEFNRVPDDEDSFIIAKNIANKLYRFVTDTINEQIQDTTTSEIDPDIGIYLAEDTEGQKEGKTEDITNNKITKIDLTKKVVRPKADDLSNLNEQSSKAAHFEDENGSEDQVDQPGTGMSSGNGTANRGNNCGKGQGDGSGPNDIPHKKEVIYIEPLKQRIISSNRNGGEFIIIYLPSKSAENCCIEVQISAESQNYNAEIISAKDEEGNDLKVSGNKITGLTLLNGKSLRLKVKIAHISGYCCMELKAYGNQI